MCQVNTGTCMYGYIGCLDWDDQYVFLVLEYVCQLSGLKIF